MTPTVVNLTVDSGSTSLERVTPSMLAMVEQQTDLVVIDIQEEVKALTADAATIKTSVLGIQVTDQSSMDAIAAHVVTAKDKIKAVDKLTKPVRQFLDRLHSNACNLGSGSVKDLKEAVKVGTERMEVYARARKAAADEVRRIADEAVRRENEECARRLQEEEESRLRQAELLRKAGLAQEAERLAQAPPVAVALPTVQVVAQAAPRVAGLSERYPFEGKCVDIMQTIRTIAAGEIPLTYTNAKGEQKDLLEINQPLLNFLAKQRQKDLGIPGCVSEETVSFARSRS